jgi:Icc-related predicted phosphoesterase
MPRKLKVAALADLHVKEGQVRPYRELFSEICRVADVLVLAGDLTDLGKPEEARILAEDVQSCSIPVLAVLGNHDHESNQAEEVRKVLREARVSILEGQTQVIKDVGFVGAKGFGGGFGRRMLTAFGEPAIKNFVAEGMSEATRLENGLRALHTDKIFVVLHYAPVVATLAGEPPEIYPFLGSSRLAEAIDRYQVSAVVHGHAHHGKYEGRTPGGVPVYNVASHIKKPTGKPYGLIEV